MDCCRRHCRDFIRNRNSACVQFFYQRAVILLHKTTRPLRRADWKLHIIFVCIISHNAQILNFPANCAQLPSLMPVSTLLMVEESPFIAEVTVIPCP